MKIGNFELCGGNATFVIAEIGINHNGDIKIAKELIKAAKDAGCNAVKFQKRTIEVVYTEQELANHRESPFGTTNGDLKRGLEFSREVYAEIDRYCKEFDIIWFASPWDEQSVDFLESFNVPCHKIAAASLTDAGLLKKLKATGKPILLSTGMSELEEIDKAVALFDKSKLLLFHCVSLYPAPSDKVNLRGIKTLSERYGVPVGYSGHELDTIISAAAIAIGAVAVERHFTLDRGMWGSDHKASINPQEMTELVRNIRLVEQSLGDGKIMCLPEEVPVKQKLRRVDTI
jgi:N-acetylneuraminate synthase